MAHIFQSTEVPTVPAKGYQNRRDTRPTKGCLGHRDYVLFEVIGSGGMGEVHRAADLVHNKLVAIKAMHPSLAGRPHLVAQFRHEGELVARISHRNVVSFIDACSDGGQHYLVFEYLRGRTLARKIADDGPPNPAQFVVLAQQLIAAVGAIHQAGVIHADLKSANVMVTGTDNAERIKIIDFGLGHTLLPTTPTARGISGTPGYMAPELILGDPTTAASDQYALGVVLYELLTGHQPFEQATAEATFDDQLHKLPLAPSQCAGTHAIPAALETVMLRMLAKDPSARFASIDAIPLAAFKVW